MKGQYLAIESMMALGMGLVVAIGSISIFTSYKQEVLDRGKDKQIDMIQSEITDAVFNLQNADSGQISIELPDDLADSDYTMTFDEGLKIKSSQRTYESSFGDLENRFIFTGSVEGGSVKVFKRENEFSLRAN